MSLHGTTDREALAVLAFLLQEGQDWRSGYAGSAMADPGLVFYAGDMAFKPAGALVCRRCGAEDRPVLGPGSGQHTASALCRHCGCHLKWLSTKSEEQREAQHQKARQ